MRSKPVRYSSIEKAETEVARDVGKVYRAIRDYRECFDGLDSEQLRDIEIRLGGMVDEILSGRVAEQYGYCRSGACLQSGSVDAYGLPGPV